MKFSNIFFFASLALAAPAVQAQDQTAVGAIQDSVNQLQTATTSNFGDIQKAIETIKGNVGASVEAQIKSTITANLKAIAQALNEATDSITKATTRSAGGIVANARGLSQSQIDQLTEAVKTALSVLRGIEATIELAATDLTPDIQRVIQDEIDEVKKAAIPLVLPLVRFLDAVSNLSSRAGVSVKGLQDATEQLASIPRGFVTSLGLPVGTVAGLGAKLGL